MEKRVALFRDRIGKTAYIGVWEDVGEQSLQVYKSVVDQLLQQSLIPLSDSLEYWDSVVDSGPRGVILFGIQNAFNLKEWRYTTVREHIVKCRKEVYEKRSEAAELLGGLIQTAFKSNVDNATTKDIACSSLENLLKTRGDVDQHIGSLSEISSEEQAVRALSYLRDRIAQQSYSNQFRRTLGQFGKPSKVIRYWPVFLIGGVALFKIVGNWQNLKSWFQIQVLETARSLWTNWILEPIWKIYQTIRHDENAQVAIMTKQSLESDMRSLERMVVQFAKKSGEDLNDTNLIARVQQGDISAVLIPYERQIQTPLKSIVGGNLVQALLIQVQKTKVDVEVAMNGIDKLLQSQQLVFGLVAALPSIAFVWWAGGQTFQILQGKSRQVRGINRLTKKIQVGLGQVEQLLMSNRRHQVLDAQTLGLVVAQTQFLRRWGRQVLGSGQLYRQFSRRLDDLEDPESIVDDHIEALRWIYLAGFGR